MWWWIGLACLFGVWVWSCGNCTLTLAWKLNTPSWSRRYSTVLCTCSNCPTPISIQCITISFLWRYWSGLSSIIVIFCMRKLLRKSSLWLIFGCLVLLLFPLFISFLKSRLAFSIFWGLVLSHYSYPLSLYSYLMKFLILCPVLTLIKLPSLLSMSFSSILWTWIGLFWAKINSMRWSSSSGIKIRVRIPSAFWFLMNSQNLKFRILSYCLFSLRKRWGKKLVSDI